MLNNKRHLNKCLNKTADKYARAKSVDGGIPQARHHTWKPKHARNHGDVKKGRSQAPAQRRL